MKTYHVYYLPNANDRIHENGNRIHGKVGYSSLSYEQRLKLNSYRHDITGAIMLHDNIMTKQEALDLEYYYQQKYDCIDKRKPHNRKTGKKIVAINFVTNEEIIFESIRAAAAKLGFSVGQIGLCAKRISTHVDNWIFRDYKYYKKENK